MGIGLGFPPNLLFSPGLLRSVSPQRPSTPPRHSLGLCNRDSSPSDMRPSRAVGALLLPPSASMMVTPDGSVAAPSLGPALLAGNRQGSPHWKPPRPSGPFTCDLP